jgi:D123
VDKRHRVWIVDFNPLGKPSSSILFEWSELRSAIDKVKEGNAGLRRGVAATGSKCVVTPGITECDHHTGSSCCDVVEISTTIDANDLAFDSNSNIDCTQQRDLGVSNGFYYDFEFRIIQSKEETFPSAAASTRGPIDVTLAPDFSKFMEICKSQQQEDDD